jgi:hypothetical protein
MCRLLHKKCLQVIKMARFPDPVIPPTKVDPPTGGAPPTPKPTPGDPSVPGGGAGKADPPTNINTAPPKDRYSGTKKAAAAATLAGLGGYYYYLKKKEDDEAVKECVQKCVPVNWDDYIGFEDSLWKSCKELTDDEKANVECKGNDVHKLGYDEDYYLTEQITREELIYNPVGEREEDQPYCSEETPDPIDPTCPDYCQEECEEIHKRDWSNPFEWFNRDDLPGWLNDLLPDDILPPHYKEILIRENHEILVKES